MTLERFFFLHSDLQIFQLLSAEKIRGEFERAVLGDTAAQIERHVNGLIDWTIERHSKHWRRVIDYATEKANTYIRNQNLIGKVESEFEYNRTKMLNTMGNDSQKIVATYDKTEEARQLADEVRTAIYSTAAIEVTAIGVGSLVAASLLDLTGVFFAGSLAITGLCVIPYKRVQVKRMFNQRITALRTDMKTVIRNHFERELIDSVSKIRDSVSPYTLYVKTEKEKLDKTKVKIEETIKNVTGSMHAVELAFKKEGASDLEEDQDDL